MYLPQWGKVNEVWSEVVDDGTEGKPVLEQVHSYHPPHHLCHQCSSMSSMLPPSSCSPSSKWTCQWWWRWGSRRWPSDTRSAGLGLLFAPRASWLLGLFHLAQLVWLRWTFSVFVNLAELLGRLTALHLVLGWESVGLTLKTDLDLALETVTKSEFRNSHWRRNFDWSENFRLKKALWKTEKRASKQRIEWL